MFGESPGVPSSPPAWPEVCLTWWSPISPAVWDSRPPSLSRGLTPCSAWLCHSWAWGSSPRKKLYYLSLSLSLSTLWCSHLGVGSGGVRLFPARLHHGVVLSAAPLVGLEGARQEGPGETGHYTMETWCLPSHRLQLRQGTRAESFHSWRTSPLNLYNSSPLSSPDITCRVTRSQRPLTFRLQYCDRRPESW